MIIVCAGCTYMYYSSNNKKLIDYFINGVSEFNEFEQKRLNIYLDNLIRNPPSKEILSKDQKGLCTYDPTHKFYYKNVIKDTDTKSDLSLCEGSSNKLFKVSLDTDSIEWFDVPTITKTRHIYGKNIRRPYAIIARLRSKVHFGLLPEVKAMRGKVPWKDKQSTIIWRGGPSGTGFTNVYESELYKPSRETMLKLWCNTQVVEDIDVGLISKWNFRNFTHFLKEEKTIEEMLKYKYLLSVEGNDVATNLKWAMYSDSLVIMPKPCVESWYTESMLEPWVHYVPVKDDFSDLLEIKKWCDANAETCKKIIQNANQYAEQFTNNDREVYLHKYVMGKYFELVNFYYK